MDEPSEKSTGPAWFDVAFGALYPVLYAHRDDASAALETAFAVERMGLSTGARILDLACGSGRHSRALRAEGLVVIGMDRSAPLLREAAKRGNDAFARGDMRQLPFRDGAFAGVCSFFTSFGYFEDEADDRRVLAEVARVLEPHGCYLLDFLDAGHVARAIVPRSERVVAGFRLVEERRIEGKRVCKRVTISGAALEAPVVYEETVTLYTEDDLTQHLASAGLDVRASFGGFDGRPAGTGDRRILIAGRRA